MVRNIKQKDLVEDMKEPTFGSEEVDEMVSSSEIGKGDNKKPSKDRIRFI